MENREEKFLKEEIMSNTNFLTGFGEGGRENIAASDLKNAYLTILSKQSGAVNKMKPEAYVEGAEVGDFFNTKTKKSYGKTVELVYLQHFVSWDVYKPGGGDFVGRFKPNTITVTDDWPMKTKEGFDVKEAYNFLVLVKGEEDQGPVYFTAKGTGIRHAKNWLNSMNNLKLPSGELCPLFGGVWTLESKYNEKSGNDWFTFGVGKDTAVKNTGFIDEKVYAENVAPALEVVKQITVPSGTGTTLQIEAAEDLDNI
jgi:hypothetical protein